MIKLTTALIGFSIFIFATFTGTSAFASDVCSTASAPIYGSDWGFDASLDKDKDGVICEKGPASSVPVVPANPSVPGTSTGVIPAQPEVTGTTAPTVPGVLSDGNGGFVKIDDSGNKVAVDAHGNPLEDKSKLATTGFSAVALWVGLGLAALGTALFFLRKKLKLVN